jgi:uncharacterized OB-fold protein
MTTNYEKALPEIDEDNAEFFDSCRNHAMKLQRCLGCDTFRYYPSAVCPMCQSFAFEWHEVSGDASVYTFTVVHRPPSDAWAADVPYVYALVQLEEGPMMPTNVIGCDPSEVGIGMPVRVVYRDATDEITIPLFAPRR